MFCHRCGKELEENDKFCNSCGSTVETSKKRDYWKWISYSWIVVINLITIGIVLAIYENVYSSFETIVVSLLILIYLSLQSFYMMYVKVSAETAFALDAEFKRIRRILKDDPDEYETEEAQEAKKKVDRAMTKMYIKAVFLGIISLIAIFNILGTL